MGGVRLSNKFSYFYILRDTFFGFGFLHSCFLFFFSLLLALQKISGDSVGLKQKTAL